MDGLPKEGDGDYPLQLDEVSSWEGDSLAPANGGKLPTE